jgi:hypothetical protein
LPLARTRAVGFINVGGYNTNRDFELPALGKQTLGLVHSPRSFRSNAYGVVPYLDDNMHSNEKNTENDLDTEELKQR